MITINNRDPRPIYLQIKEGLCRLILTGVLAEGERMPSVRELAGQLAINPNTIQRAYRELEMQGYIATVPGKGCFVCGGMTSAHKEQQPLWNALDDVIRQLQDMGVTKGELLRHIRQGGDHHA